MKNFLIQNYNNKIVIDISALPYLKTIMNSLTDTNKEITVYIPDTIKKLIVEGKKKNEYFMYLDRLVAKWTPESIEFDFLETLVKEEKFQNIKVVFGGREDSDGDVYEDLYHNIKSKDLTPEFSPPFNLLGDTIGKIVGIAKKQSAYILMRTRRLLSLLKDRITVINQAFNEFHQEKIDFFAANFPQLRYVRGARWFIGIVISGVSIAVAGVEFGLTGFALGVFDP